MEFDYKICVDCADPYAVIGFWAAAMEWDIEDNTALIEDLRSKGIVTSDDYVEVDGRLGFSTAAAIRNPDTSQRGGRILFQQVPEPKVAKNRVHIDVHVGPDRRDEVVAKLTALGGSVIGDGDENGSTWIVMADPEGNELCIA
jgi:Glyoxalase-like domain